jgi:hypothetical protein
MDDDVGSFQGSHLHLVLGEFDSHAAAAERLGQASGVVHAAEAGVRVGRVESQ